MGESVLLTVSMILTLVLSSLVSVATNSLTMSLKTALGLLSAETRKPWALLDASTEVGQLHTDF